MTRRHIAAVGLALFVIASDRVYAQPAEAVPLGYGVGATTPAPRLTIDPPALGTTVAIRATALTPGAAGALVLARGAAPLALPSGAAAFVDLGDVRAWIPSASDAAGRFEHAIAIPSAPALLGIELVAQGYVSSSAPAGIDVTNGIRLRVGSHVTPPSGALAGLPSTGGPGLRALQSLAPGSWVDLGVPAPDPAHGLATGRSYTPRLAPAAHLGGAFFTGEGTHGYVVPATGRYVDDVWFYDLAAHRWICVKPGSHVATLALRLNEDRFEVDAQGAPIPVAQLGHGYELVTVDESRRAFVMVAAPNTYWTNAMPQRLAWLGNVSLPASQAASPWLFEEATGRWRREPPGATRPTLDVTGRSVVVHYVPSRRATWCWDKSAAQRRTVWYFDASTYRWSPVALAQDGPRITGTGVSCFDRTRERIYFFAVDETGTAFRLWFFDVATSRWVDTGATGMPPLAGRTPYVSAYAGLTFDDASGRVLVRLTGPSASYPSFHVFDPTTGAFDPEPIAPPAALRSHFTFAATNAFYAGDYDAHILHVAGERGRTGRFLAFRLGR